MRAVVLCGLKYDSLALVCMEYPSVCFCFCLQFNLDSFSLSRLVTKEGRGTGALPQNLCLLSVEKGLGLRAVTSPWPGQLGTAPALLLAAP